ncbi:MAG TPA: hypothetical protein VGD00_08760, partial [Solirubrobacteraceae bacterium]
MRRMLSSVAVLAAALLAPSAASATTAPQILTPIPISGSNSSTSVPLTWTDAGGPLVVYRVFRDTTTSAVNCAAAHSGTELTGSTGLTGTSFTDTVPGEDIYCYWV